MSTIPEIQETFMDPRKTSLVRMEVKFSQATTEALKLILITRHWVELYLDSQR